MFFRFPRPRGDFLIHPVWPPTIWHHRIPGFRATPPTRGRMSAYDAHQLTRMDGVYWWLPLGSSDIFVLFAHCFSQYFTRIAVNDVFMRIIISYRLCYLHKQSLFYLLYFCMNRILCLLSFHTLPPPLLLHFFSPLIFWFIFYKIERKPSSHSLFTCKVLRKKSGSGRGEKIY